MENIKVAVRMRPFNGREMDRKATCIIRMVGVKTLIINPDTQEEKEVTTAIGFSTTEYRTCSPRKKNSRRADGRVCPRDVARR